MVRVGEVFLRRHGKQKAGGSGFWEGQGFVKCHDLRKKKFSKLKRND